MSFIKSWLKKRKLKKNAGILSKYDDVLSKCADIYKLAPDSKELEELSPEVLDAVVELNTVNRILSLDSATLIKDLEELRKSL